MHRRRLLGALGAGIAGLAGCSGSNPEPAARSPAPTATPTATPIGSPAPTTTGPATRPRPEAPEPADVDDAPGRLLSIEAPARVQIGDSVRYRFTLENADEEPATFEPTVSARSGSADWSVRDRWEPVDVAPGERHTFVSAPLTSAFLATVELRIDGSGERFDVDFEERRLTFDESYLDPLDREVSVGEIGTRGVYEYADGEYDRIVEAGDGLQWVFVTVGVVNRVSESVGSPEPSEFSLVSGERTYRPVELRSEDGYERRRLPEGSGASGVIGFKAPSSDSRTDFDVRWDASFAGGEVGVLWNED